MRIQFIFLTLLVITNLVLSACPNDCSGNGNCQGTTCACNADYTGNDCSIYQKTLTRDAWVEGSVEIWSWKYYSFSTGFGAGNVRFEVESLDDEGDCDLYIKQGSRPTRSDYDIKDTDTSADATVDVISAQAGTYYAGVFGFYPCHYRIRVRFLGSCSVPCGDHGRCVNGACVCDSGYSGTGCTETNIPMTVGQTYTNQVGEQEWKYYKLGLEQTYNAIKVALTQTGTDETEDCDLYARFGELPTVYDWDYFDQNWRETNSEVNMVQPQVGDWYIGVYGYAACHFSIIATSQSGCPNKCSHRGVCQAGACRCNIGYSGRYCEETLEPMLIGQRLNGYVEYLTWNYYHLNTDSQSSLLVTVSQDSASSDCDIYVRNGQKPTPTEYDFYDVSYTQVSNVTVTNPGTSTWYIGIYGMSYNSPCQYTLTTSITSNCGSCVHGECLEFGYCFCESGWAGESCDQNVRQLSNNVAIADSVSSKKWKYYSFTSSATTITFSLREKNTVGYIWMYEAIETSPTLRYYDSQDIDTDKAFHTITVDASYWTLQQQDDPTEFTYYVGIYGSPYASRDVQYDLVAWETPFKK